MKKLKLIFLTSEGKRHIFYPQVDSDKITDKEIQKNYPTVAYCG